MTTRQQLRAMVTGYRLSAALNVAADLGISDLLVGGPRTIDDLAATTGTDPDTLRRLLHALATIGVYDERSDGSFANTDLGEGLRSDVPDSVRPLARTLNSPGLWGAWGHLGHSVRTGENAFRAKHGVDPWTHRQGAPEENAIFNQTMTMQTSVIAPAVAEVCDLSGLSTVVDVGGGEGILLEAVLTRHPHLTGTLFDREHVVGAEPASSDLSARWSAVSGSFFDAVPAADAYLLKSILHDWPDQECVDILATCRRGLRPGGVVLVIETLLGRPGFEAEAAFLDINMLVMPGGRERTEQQYGALLDAAGLRLDAVADTPARMSVLHARVA